jgi:hypothetical protein
MERVLTVAVAVILAAGTLCAGPRQGDWKKGATSAEEHPYTMVEGPVTADAEYVYSPPPPFIFPAHRGFGTYTGLTGFWDYQSNGGSIQHIRVDPASGHIHTIMMIADDSASISPSRRTAYSYSTDGGNVWNTFNDVRVPGRRSGFPTLDLGRGPVIDGAPIVANHSDFVSPTITKTTVHIDAPPGTGAFAELPTQPNFDPYEPIWPYVAGAADGSIVTHASMSLPTGVTRDEVNYFQRTEDFANWSTWTPFPIPHLVGGRYPTVANATGRVATLMHGSGSLRLYESTNNGQTWSLASEIYPPNGVPAGEDTLQAFGHSDVVYEGNTPLVVAGVTRRSSTGGNFFAGARFQFFRPGSGLSLAVPWDSIGFPRGFTWPTQSNMLPVCFPSIGLSGSRIVIVYTGFLADSTTIDPVTNRRFADVFYVQSSDGGLSWTEPVNITNTPSLDERYASLSKWNPDGYAYVVWQEDTRAGAAATGTPEAPVTRASQVFYKIDLTATSAGEPAPVPGEFVLRQNYPNPFNPSTSISYTVPHGSVVKISVHNVLGQEVARLVDDYKPAGSYVAQFHADNVSSGVYYYTLTAGQFSSTRKMILIR